MLASGYSIRSVRRDEDAPGVAALIEAFDLWAHGRPTETLDDLIGSWNGWIVEPERFAWVVVDPSEQIAGYGYALEHIAGKELFGENFVHPKHAGLGIGTFLANHMEQAFLGFATAQPDAAFTAFSVTDGNDPGACALFCDRGYQITRRDWAMVIDISSDYRAPTSPDGITIRQFDWDRDAREVHRALEASFSEHRNSKRRDFDEWARDARSHPQYDPTLWRIALDGDQVVGATRVINQGDRGLVWTLGVLSSHRGRGVGEALLREAFASLAQRGQTQIELHVDSGNSTGATRLYERVGMKVERSFIFHSIDAAKLPTR